MDRRTSPLHKAHGGIKTVQGVTAYSLDMGKYRRHIADINISVSILYWHFSYSIYLYRIGDK